MKRLVEGGVGGGEGVSVIVMSSFTRFYIDSADAPLQNHTYHTSVTITCDGVEYFFGKGGVHRVAMASDWNRPSCHYPPDTEVISRALVRQKRGRIST